MLEVTRILFTLRTHDLRFQGIQWFFKGHLNFTVSPRNELGLQSDISHCHEDFTCLRTGTTSQILLFHTSALKHCRQNSSEPT